MKQGSGHSSKGPAKQEPKAKAINPGYAAQLGNMVGERRAVVPMSAGRGFTAPKGKSSTHKGGSQGEH